jgi:DNA polymerase-3 subunit alpha
VNKRSIEALIKCGAFGSTGDSRKGMLEVLEAAQAAGAKAQLDAQIGQGSIFDLGGFGGGDATPAFAAPSHPPVPREEFSRPELLAGEKESIGLFLTEHPLKRVRDAIRAKTDCGCGEVIGRKNDEWIKVGGMITAAKKIRTRTGSQVMFATIDDLEGSVELVVFEKSLAAAEGAMAVDQIVLVRGRVDQKEAGKVCVIVQDVERFDPDDAEVERAREAAAKANVPPAPLRLRVDAGRLPATIIDELKRIFEDHPGESEVVLEMQTRSGPRRLRFGSGYRVAGRNAALKAELDRLLGPALPAGPPTPLPTGAGAGAAVAVAVAGRAATERPVAVAAG